MSEETNKILIWGAITLLFMLIIPSFFVVTGIVTNGGERQPLTNYQEECVQSHVEYDLLIVYNAYPEFNLKQYTFMVSYEDIKRFPKYETFGDTRHKLNTTEVCDKYALVRYADDNN